MRVFYTRRSAILALEVRVFDRVVRLAYPFVGALREQCAVSASTGSAVEDLPKRLDHRL
jgi:hypothetical protein